VTAERQSKDVFISYLRTQSARVIPAVAALEAAGIRCFLDQHDIKPLEPFPQRLRQAIGDSLALLAWWSADFADSDHCLEEFRTAWQHARRQTSALHTRLWVINPGSTVSHICAGELDAQNFLRAPEPGLEGTWAKALALQLAPRLAELRPLGTLAQEAQALFAGGLHGVPQKSPHFTGRNAALMRIHSQLHPPKVGAQAWAVAVQTHGLAGIGKTELATAYANDFAHAYPGGVFWLRLSALDHVAQVDEAQGQFAWLSAVDLALQYHPLADALRDDKGQLLGPMEARRRLAGLKLPGPALWVLDNVPVLTPEPLRDALLAFWRAPFTDTCTLVTTRDSSGIAGFSPVHLDVLSPDDALRLLAKYRPISGFDEKRPAEDIVTQTGGHTQALVLLGEHVKRSALGYVNLMAEMNAVGTLERIETVSALLRSSLGERARGVLAAYAISLRPLNANARQLLTLAALCESNGAFPAALLVDAAGMDGDAASAALDSLTRSALLTQRNSKDCALTLVEIHPLTAQVCLQLLPTMDGGQGHLGISPTTWPALRQALAQQLIQLFREAGDIRTHDRMKPYLAQASYFAGALEGWDSVGLWGAVGRYFDAEGAHSSVRTSSARVTQRVYDPEFSVTLSRLNSLARTLKNNDLLPQAMGVYEQRLAMAQRVLGPEHPDTLVSMNNLATTLYSMGDVLGARAMLEQALVICRRVLGPEDVQTVVTFGNLQELLFASEDWPAVARLTYRYPKTDKRFDGF